MAKLILPPAETLQRSAATLAANSAGNTPRIRALSKAGYLLALGECNIVEGFGGLYVASATRPGVVHVVSHLHGCNCEAGSNGRPCWHAALVEIIEDAARYTRPATMPKLTSRRIADPTLDALAAELYGA